MKDKGFFELEAKETRLLALCDSSVSNFDRRYYRCEAILTLPVQSI